MDGGNADFAGAQNLPPAESSAFIQSQGSTCNIQKRNVPYILLLPPNLV
jgi:hypothetical protein